MSRVFPVPESANNILLIIDTSTLLVVSSQWFQVAYFKDSFE
ncbi:MAG: hypothetical protein AAF171_18610 [Cyanobacteria bacterium P01_A01_bin.116]